MSCTRALCNAQRGGYTRVVDQSGSAVNLPADANVYRAKLEAGKVARFWPHPAIIRRAISTDILHVRARVLGQSATLTDPNLACRSLRATCEFRFSELPGADCTSPGRSARSVGQHSVVTRPRRLNGTSGMTPIGSFTFSMPASAKTTGLVSEAVAPRLASTSTVTFRCKRFGNPPRQNASREVNQGRRLDRQGSRRTGE